MVMNYLHAYRVGNDFKAAKNNVKSNVKMQINYNKSSENIK